MTEPEFKLDIGDGPFKFSEGQKYVILTLWIVGLSAGTIARLLPTTRQRVINFVTRGEYAGRSSMTDAQRQAMLDDLRAVRFEDGVPLDGGALDRLSWQIVPLTGAKRKKARA